MRVNKGRAGISLTEVLVVIAIIGILLALLIPAVQMARESSRRTQCQNNLRQLGQAMHSHESRYGRLPTNGWGYLWMGDPDRGTDKSQPGGWIYNILPDIEQTALREIGAGLPPMQKRQALQSLMQTPLALLNCPTRPNSGTGLAASSFLPHNADPISFVAKTDYAVNEGDYITNTDGGPESLTLGDDKSYPWIDVTDATGVCYLRSEVHFRDITDGTSNTYLLGEKHVSKQGYTDSSDSGYDQPMYSGVDLDLARWVLDPPIQDQTERHDRRFGSAHSQACNMLFCDGSVKAVSYSISGEVHLRLGNRQDGLPVTVP